ncbi:MAG: homoserine kinase [Leptolyngbya sp. SIO4C1]|nr:homoserine kinase [Leptolyngbya sp. SIO4C1]
MPTTATVTVPATTANIGPGFDCLGAALTLSNRFILTPSQQLQITVSGREAQRVSRSENNLAYRAFAALYQKLGQPPPPIRLAIELLVPLSRGLGSSSTAIVGGLVGANLLAGSPFDQAALAALATELEGHPDNVVPALLGGCRLTATDGGHSTLCPVDWHRSVVPIVAIPDFELSTAKARQVLPETYSRADAIFNAAHLGLLLQGLASGNGDWLRAALRDRIHQPYRQALIPGYEAVQQAAIAAGAWGLVISGAGPTLLALASSDSTAAVQQAMQAAWADQPFAVQVMALAIDQQGTLGTLAIADS